MATRHTDQVLETPAYDGTPQRPLRSDARRNYERIVAAARETLRELGADASLEEIARRAGVGIGTLYRRFPSRLALLEAVYREDVDTLRQRSQDVVETASEWDAVAAWVDIFLAYASTKRALFHELVEAVGRDAELLTYSRQVITDTAGQVLDNGKRAGVVRPDVEPSDLLRLIGGCSMMGEIDEAQRQRVVAIVLAGIRA
ncbi:MAG: TetR/AcrR family transcriptional regulator [Actinomycetes bacterium]